jgi:hypothetical protein
MTLVAERDALLKPEPASGLPGATVMDESEPGFVIWKRHCVLMLLFFC